MKKFIAGGCSFTLGNELSDDVDGHTPSKKTWAYGLHDPTVVDYTCAAYGGSGNSGIARRTFNAIKQNEGEVECVVVMWRFLSRYDWAMPRHMILEDTRWATISPWDTRKGVDEAMRKMAGAEQQQLEWQQRRDNFAQTGVKGFAESIYRYAANEYHEVYLSWKSIIWLQNILEKKKIPYMFTLADNQLFYQNMEMHSDIDRSMRDLHSEIDLSKWFFFGERCMGFNQWSLLNDYERATTHPLDKAHEDAIMLMKPEFDRIIGEQK